MFPFLLKSEFKINFSVEEYVSLYTINMSVFIPVMSLLFLWGKEFVQVDVLGPHRSSSAALAPPLMGRVTVGEIPNFSEPWRLHQ